MVGRWTGFEPDCWRGQAVGSGFAGGKAPTWTAAGRNSGRPVGVARRWHKVLTAWRRQHGRPAGGIRAGLLAWPSGGIRLCRRGGANMDGCRAGFGPAPIQSKTACRRNSSSCKPTSSLSFPFVSPSLCRAPTVSLFVFLQSVFLQDYTVHLTMYSPSW